jgi:hypothetical protein
MAGRAGFFRVQFGIVQRTRGGSAIRRAAYQGCCRLRAANGQTFDYSVKVEEHVQTIILAPPGCPPWVQDPQLLWARAAAAERRADAQEARTIDVSIPRELPAQHYADFARALVAPFVALGMIAQIDIHVTRASDGRLNPHIHIMLTLREVVGCEFSAKKAREWNRLFFGDGQAQAARAKMADAQTAYCRSRNIDFCADPRSNRDRHLPPPLPTIPHWNFLASRAGRRTKWMKQLDADKELRANISNLEAELRAIEAQIAREVAWQDFVTARVLGFSERSPERRLSEGSRRRNRTAPPAVSCKIPQFCLDHVSELSQQSTPHVAGSAPCGQDADGCCGSMQLLTK